MMCLVLLGGVWEPIVQWRTYVHHLHTFLHTGSGLYNPLQHSQCVSRPHILYNISTTLYNTLQSTALQHFYSLQPLQHPSVKVPTQNSAVGLFLVRFPAFLIGAPDYRLL